MFGELSHGRLEGDATARAGFLARLGHDFHIAVKGSQELHQALDRILTEVPLEQSGDFGLADAHEGTRFSLCEFVAVGEAEQLGYDLSLEKVGIRVRQPQVCKDMTLGLVNLSRCFAHRFHYEYLLIMDQGN